jgi:hypothetical protein
MRTATDYYIVEVQAPEWQYVVEELIILPNTARTPDDNILTLENKFPVYYLRKTAYSAELLAAKFGTTPDMIKQAKVIKLEPFTESGMFPDPTVRDWGTA